MAGVQNLSYVAFAVVAYAAMTGVSSGVSIDEMFAYDAKTPFDVRESPAVNADAGVQVRDLDYAAATVARGRAKAYVVAPAADGKSRPGVVFFHWYGTPNGNRVQFLDEAKALARDGVVSLLVEGRFPWAGDPVDGPTDRQRVVDETIELRRAIDLLIAQRGVDPQRIAFVGHDYGAMYGAIAAGTEKRVRAWVLVAGTGSFGTWSLGYWHKDKPPQFKEAYRTALAPIEPIVRIAHAAPAALLFQFANADEHVSRADAEAFYSAASEPKQIEWYDGKHELNVERARTDRRAWLFGKLGLK